ncbi:hypothetical protein GBL_1284 [Geobacillus kaustophilus GBlys]|uniref:Major facilitator superfamily (MFS) profile domain-containing protein n=1 Tax=Geobacillus kaustophilus GBlys TaxID=1337888 RepID=U2X3B5_GEOKU|nr:hypothetical protein GBL_1284 [Geobacillus kaustophilus GBlys]GAJ58580.1 hypothetical protein B23_1791 [Geobacillus thermoleovorans B23]
MFLLGSILCGMAQTIVQLSIFRAIQGIGGEALVPIAFTIMLPQRDVRVYALVCGRDRAVWHD